jgi:hypothetical protein
MPERPNGPVGLGHAQTLKPAEVFKSVIEIDGAMFPGIVPAYNKDSACALLDIFMLANRPRVQGYVLTTMKDELLSSVQAGLFTRAMTQGTSLKGPPPPEKKEPAPRLDFWDLVQVKPKEPMTDSKASTFVVEIIIDGIVDKQPVIGLNKESMISMLIAATVEKLPRISGWNLWNDSGELLASVPAIEFMAKLAEKTALSKQSADPKTAGWRALPVVTPTSDEFAKMIEDAKKEGKTPK